MADPLLEAYLAALEGSWRALSAGWSGGRVVAARGYLASCSDNPVLDNAVLLDAASLPEVIALMGAHRASYAVWTLAGDTAAAARAARLVPSERTVAMVCSLPGWQPPERPDPAVEVVAGADPALVEGLNHLMPGMLRDLPGGRCWADRAGRSGLLIVDVPPHANVSMVVTHPSWRRRGLAAGVLTAALADARDRGLETASLQATSAGAGLYARLGFQPVATVREWVPG